MSRGVGFTSCLVLACIVTTPTPSDARLDSPESRKAALKGQQALLTAARRFF